MVEECDSVLILDQFMPQLWYPKDLLHACFVCYATPQKVEIIRETVEVYDCFACDVIVLVCSLYGVALGSATHRTAYVAERQTFIATRNGELCDLW